MKFATCLAVLCLLVTLPVTAQQPGFQDALVDHLAGDWVLNGMIAGGETTHDIAAEWVLGHQYLRLHEISRETTADGEPAYEAIVFIGWDEVSSRYACLWLDCTGGGGLSAAGIGHAERDDDELAFLFTAPDGSEFHTTFAYDREAGTWQWRMDAGPEGALQPFARVTLTRS